MSTPANEPPVAATQLFSFGGYTGETGGLPGVGFWPRAAARLIDLITHYIVTLCTGLVLGIVVAVAAAASGHAAGLLLGKLTRTSLTTILFALLGSSAYETICESIHGSTLGKLMLSMVVVQEDGSPCRFGSALIRSLAYFVDSLFFGLIGYFAMQKTPQEQRHGDTWAHTVVCKRSNVPPQSLRSGGRFIGALFLAAIADSMILMIGLVLNLAM